jgi:catechol 2,3-dioxygenase-like lactoylglutathione lyase family enzyme
MQNHREGAYTPNVPRPPRRVAGLTRRPWASKLRAVTDSRGFTMLDSSPVVAVVAVADIDRGREFYGGTLGLRETGDEPGGVLYACGGGTQLLVYQSGFAGTNQATAASWQVEDLEAEIGALRAKGISFEQYDLPGVEREGDVHSIGGLRAAWFKDPDGNILNLVTRE